METEIVVLVTHWLSFNLHIDLGYERRSNIQ